MAHSTSQAAADSRSAQLHLTDRPVELRFAFEGRQSRVGATASMAAHIGIALVILLAIRFAPRPAAFEMPPDTPLNDLVWLAEPGPGGGGGGCGNRAPEPPRLAHDLPGTGKFLP